MSDESVHVMFFCLGNICRSPLAEGIFTHKIDERGLADRFVIESSGTSSYHVGEAPDPGSQRVAREELALDISDQRSQQLSRDHLESFEYLVAMDRSNRRRASELSETIGEDEIHLLRDFDPEADDPDVPDPYGGGQNQFDLVYEIVDRSTDRFLEHLLEHDERL